MNVTRIKMKTYLKTNTQGDLAAKFGKTQGWVSQIVQRLPNIELVIVDDKITALEYSIPRKKKILIAV